ncbi:Prefoldin subunit-domain-containing protein [Xylaria sp. FL0933]|nr:Prefoldin subunit-domain-containing protein [Xylaria sp. FL0933]
MTQVRDPLQDLEKHLGQLEEQVDKLIIALDEWRQWKQEYEALRTDVQALTATATRAALGQTRQAFKGELVNEKELTDIFGRDDSRKRDQVISTISNRLDYVSRNITTLAKQLEAAENKLAATRVVANPEATDEEGLPITEISEELDDDDNVISYSLRQPGNSQPQLMEALEKAGVKEIPPDAHEPTPSITSTTQNSTAAVPSNSADAKPQPSPDAGSIAQASQAKQPPKKKSVTFTEDTKEAHESKPSNSVQRLEELYRQAKEQENFISDPIMPADESPEDAELREDMIRYNKETMLYEMAPIVAELELEEGSGDNDDDWDYGDSDEDEDDEDQWGRSTSGVVDDEYRREMLELKERLSKQTFGEQKGSDEEDDEFAEGIGRIAIRPEQSGPIQNGSSDLPTANSNPPINSAPEDEVKKSVRFASALDIAEPPSSSSQLQPPNTQLPEVDPLSDVVERRSSGPSNVTSSSPRKPSRFRKERVNGPPVAQMPPIAPEKPTDTTKYAPSGPEGQTLASTILEHEPSNEIKEPDELDANLLHQQVTEEYYKMRNKIIGRQGGFLKENTDIIQPLEEEEGGPKRLSRFKAARLAKS